MPTPLRAAVLTVSDSVFQGKRRDGSGPAVVELLQQNGWTVAHTRVVADDLAVLTATFRELSSQNVGAVFTTGGTGVAPSDVTPEATRKVITREIPGLAEQMRRDGAKASPTAALSRGVTGICGRMLVINLPGSTPGAVDSLKSILPILPHAVQLLAGENPHPE